MLGYRVDTSSLRGSRWVDQTIVEVGGIAADGAGTISQNAAGKTLWNRTFPRIPRQTAAPQQATAASSTVFHCQARPWNDRRASVPSEAIADGRLINAHTDDGAGFDAGDELFDLGKVARAKRDKALAVCFCGGVPLIEIIP